MSVLSGETFASSMSPDVLEDWLAVLFQENKTQLEDASSASIEVMRRILCSIAHTVTMTGSW